MRVEWSPSALDDRSAIVDYIAADSAEAAIAVDDRIEEQVDSLTVFPERGRPGRVPGTRELVIQGFPYIAVYQVNARRILVLRVVHGARQWPLLEAARSR